jgi:hypothetical protein
MTTTAAAPQTKGTLDACACPWCKKVHSLRGFEDYAVMHGMERDSVFQCATDDKGPGCQRYFRVVRIQPVTLIWLERYSGNPRSPT